MVSHLSLILVAPFDVNRPDRDYENEQHVDPYYKTMLESLKPKIIKFDKIVKCKRMRTIFYTLSRVNLLPG